MPIPVYDALVARDYMKGGSTKPWLVDVNANGTINPYVIKLYKRETLEQYNAVRNDLIVSRLCEEFELNSPKYALIRLSNDFIDSLDQEKREQFKFVDSRVKFGTELISNNFPYLERYYSKLEIHELGTIYAFDCMILNVDRRKDKPNLILDSSDNIYLIDHELSLRDDIPDLRYNHFINYYNYKNHLFYKRIYSTRLDYNALFDTFEYFLNLLNVDILDEVFDSLANNGYDMTHSFRVKNYIQDVKDNSRSFVDLLKGTLSR